MDSHVERSIRLSLSCPYVSFFFRIPYPHFIAHSNGLAGIVQLRTLPATVEIRKRIAADLPPLVADPMQIHQTLMNLCTGFSKRITDTKAKEIGVRALVMKPLSSRELARTVRRVLDGT